MLVVEPDYLPDSNVFFNMLGPHSQKWGCRGDFPPTTVTKGGGDNFSIPPLVGDSGEILPKKKFGKNCLVKYCNFIVNMDHSL
jgi:hypothetical protein